MADKTYPFKVRQNRFKRGESDFSVIDTRTRPVEVVCLHVKKPTAQQCADQHNISEATRLSNESGDERPYNIRREEIERAYYASKRS